LPCAVRTFIYSAPFAIVIVSDSI